MKDCLKEVTVNRNSWINGFFSMTFYSTMTAFAGVWAIPFIHSTYDVTKVVAATIVSMNFIGWLIGGPWWVFSPTAFTIEKNSLWRQLFFHSSPSASYSICPRCPYLSSTFSSFSSALSLQPNCSVFQSLLRSTVSAPRVHLPPSPIF